MNPRFPSIPILGIDVSKLSFDACLLSPAGTKHTSAFPNTPEGFSKLDSWLAAHGGTLCLAGLEATGSYGLNLLWHLHAQGHHTCQLNPRHVKDYVRSQGRRVKTDQVDALLIAHFLRSSDHLTLWQPPAQALRELQFLVRRRQELMEALQAERNRLHVAEHAGSVVTASLKRHITHLQKELAALNKAINAHILAHASLQHSVRLLRSIDGIGLQVAVTILAEIPQITAFQRARDLAAYAGLTPTLARSGTSVYRRGALSKQGSALLRKMLYMAALQSVKRPSNAFHGVYCSFVERGKAKMCALGAIMHKLIRVAFGVLKHQTPFIQNFAKLPA